MSTNILFVDNARQDEIELYYDACQRHRDYYRGYAHANHPLTYFIDAQYDFQCPPEMTSAYLNYAATHVKYKQPHVLPTTVGRTSGVPAAPDRTLAGRYNKAACKLFIR